MYGRCVAVKERYLGSVLSAQAVGSGYVGVLGDVYGLGVTSLTITLTEDATGDSIVIVGGNDANHLPTSIVDTAGNTYYLAASRPGHPAAGPDIYSTTGLSSTVWITRGVYDVRQLVAGDTIVISYPGTESEADVMAVDVNGIGDVAAYDAGSAGTDFGLIATRQTFNPATVVPGKVVASDHSIYMAAVYGSRHKQHVEPVLPSGYIIVDDYGDPSINEGTVVAQLSGVERGIALAVDIVNAGADPSRSMGAGMGWAEGAVIAYTPGSVITDIFLEDASDFDTTGRLRLDGDVYDYEVIDEDTGQVHLTPGLTRTYPEGAEVLIYPLSVERWANLVVGDNEGDEEGLQCRVPHALFDKVRVGIRDLDAGEGEAMQAEYATDELVITEVLAKRPDVDGSFIDPTTIPIPSDGIAPASPSPTPDLVAGTDHIKARWDAVTLNANGDPQLDPVAYDIHLVEVVPLTSATLDVGTGDGEYLLTAVTPGTDGNDITITVDVS